MKFVDVRQLQRAEEIYDAREVVRLHYELQFNCDYDCQWEPINQVCH